MDAMHKPSRQTKPAPTLLFASKVLAKCIVSVIAAGTVFSTLPIAHAQIQDLGAIQQVTPSSQYADNFISSALRQVGRYQPDAVINKFMQGDNYLYAIQAHNELTVNGTLYRDATIILAKIIDENGEATILTRAYPDSSPEKAMQAFMAGENRFSANDGVEMIDKNGDPVFIDLIEPGENIIKKKIVKPDVKNFQNLYGKKERGATGEALSSLRGMQSGGTKVSGKGAYAEYDLNNSKTTGGQVEVNNLSINRFGTFASKLSGSKEDSELSSSSTDTLISQTAGTTFKEFYQEFTPGQTMPSDMKERIIFIPGATKILRRITSDGFDRNLLEAESTFIPNVSFRRGFVELRPYATAGVREERVAYNGIDDVEHNQQYHIGVGVAGVYSDSSSILNAGLALESRQVFDDGAGTEFYTAGDIRCRIEGNWYAESRVNSYSVDHEKGMEGRFGIAFRVVRWSTETGIFSKYIDATDYIFRSTGAYASGLLFLDRKGMNAIGAEGTSDGENHTGNVTYSFRF